MPALALRRALVENLQLRIGLGRYVYALDRQLVQTGVCNTFHEIRCRLARWLLMTQDRVQSDQILVTHQLLADLLGVQRSAITIAAGILQKASVIRYRRGVITLLSRPGLETAACECYGK